MKSHIYTVQTQDIQHLQKLADFKNKNYYVNLTHNKFGFIDIAIWSDKYQNIAFFQSHSDKLQQMVQLN